MLKMRIEECSRKPLIREIRKNFPFILYILLPILLFHCEKRANYISSVEIRIRSQSVWVIQEDLTVKINSSGKVEQKNISDEKKVIAHVEILSYSESPSIFDLDGNPRAFSVRVKVKYKIMCLDKGKTGNAWRDMKTQGGKFSLSETFLLSSFISHLSGVKKARLSLKEKIKNRIILLSLEVC